MYLHQYQYQYGHFWTTSHSMKIYALINLKKTMRPGDDITVDFSALGRKTKISDSNSKQRKQKTSRAETK